MGRAAVRLALCCAAAWMLLHAAPGSSQTQALKAVSPEVLGALGVGSLVQQLQVLSHAGQGSGMQALLLRQQVMAQVLLASFDVDETLGRIDAEAAHAADSRYAIEAQKERRDAELNVATFAASGVLGTVGSAMQLTRSLDHAGNALGVAAGASALTLSLAQLKSHPSDKRVLRSPYNMLAEVLGQTPNGESRYPLLVETYLHAPNAGDGQLPDGQAPDRSLRTTWERLHLLKAADEKQGASVQSATADSSAGLRLSAGELADREAMLRDLHAAVALLKVDLRALLLAVQATGSEPRPAP